MTAIELLDIIGAGETSNVQFKREIGNDDSIAAEMIAFSNSKGGSILFGIEDKKGDILGLDYQRLQGINNKIAQIANDKVKPQIFLFTEVISIPTESGEKKILVAQISEGISKPYKDNSGAIWIKQGSDKRRLLDSNEQVRLFQQSGLLYLDEMVIPNTTIEDVKFSEVEKYLKIIMKKKSENLTVTETILANLNILKENRLTLGGLLFFAKHPQKYRPVFCVKAVSFFGNSIGGTEYRSSQDIEGTLPQIFEEAMRFFTTNLHHVQAGQNFNSVGKLEISQIALEELLQNALIHRDYSKNSPVKILIFNNRVEIVSPGALPNSLTVENIKMGTAVVRNNLLVSYCAKMMDYRGIGSGITRALEDQPNIELINDVDGEQFKVIIPRPEKK